jgi:transcriptional regulator with XRE-family HTH domain
MQYFCHNDGMTRASTLVRATRKSRGLTQTALAQKSKVHQSNISAIENGRDLSVATLETLLRATGHGLLAVPTTRGDAAYFGASIRTELKLGNKLRALRMLIQLNDNLVAEHGIIRGVLGLLEPEPTGHKEWDAALAGLVAWRLGQDGIPLPGWVNNARFFLARPQTLNVDSADPIPSPADVPREFLLRGVLVWEDTFQSV